MSLFYRRNELRERELILRELPVEAIAPNPDQPRRSFDEASIAELAESIKQVGLIQPLLVRRTAAGYELIAGERRLRAMMSLGQRTVRCLVDTGANSEESAIMAITENLQRRDLHYFEEAECYAALLEKLGLTQEQLAERLGKSQSFIANKMRLLKLEPQTRRLIAAVGLSERHARTLLRLPDDEEREEAAAVIAAKGLSVKDAERYVESRLKPKTQRLHPRMIRIFKDYKVFMNTVSTACEQLRECGLPVSVKQSERGGAAEIVIRVGSYKEAYAAECKKPSVGA